MVNASVSITKVLSRWLPCQRLHPHVRLFIKPTVSWVTLFNDIIISIIFLINSRYHQKTWICISGSILLMLTERPEGNHENDRESKKSRGFPPAFSKHRHWSRDVNKNQIREKGAVKHNYSLRCLQVCHATCFGFDQKLSPSRRQQ
jgi:hypothetical protein